MGASSEGAGAAGGSHSQVHSHSPRTELMLGQLAGGALLASTNNASGGAQLWKYVVGEQYPDWWYGSHSPNCTDATGGHDPAANCKDGCLFEVRSDPGEHANRAALNPDIYARMKARFEKLKASVGGAAGPLPAPGGAEAAALQRMGGYDTGGPGPWGCGAVAANAEKPVCLRMRDTYAGFFGPWEKGN